MVISATSTTLISYSLGMVSYFKYPLLMVGAIVEGPILMVASGFFLHQDVFDFVPLFIALLIGDLIGDVVWYYVGYHFGESIFNRHGKFWGISPELFADTKKLFEKYHPRILFFSKVSMAFGLIVPILIVAGATRIQFKKYLMLNFLGELFLVSWLLLIGFYLAEIYSKYIADVFKVGFIIGTVLIGAFILYFFSRFIKHKILSKIEKE